MRDLILAMSKIDNINSQWGVDHLLELQKQLGVTADITAFSYLYNDWEAREYRIDLIIGYISKTCYSIHNK